MSWIVVLSIRGRFTESQRRLLLSFFLDLALLTGLTRFFIFPVVGMVNEILVVAPLVGKIVITIRWVKPTPAAVLASPVDTCHKLSVLTGSVVRNLWSRAWGVNRPQGVEQSRQMTYIAVSFDGMAVNCIHIFAIDFCLCNKFRITQSL